MGFDVIDMKTGEYPDLEHIARTEEWAKNLIPCDIDGFCIDEAGYLILMDECGNYAYCPKDRFQVNFEFPVYSSGIEMLKCKICGTEFSVIKDKRYTARDNGVNGGLNQSLNGKQEEKLYDCFDCPNCGCQVIVQERKRKCNA